MTRIESAILYFTISAAAVAAPAMAENPAHLYRSGVNMPASKFYVALYLYRGECEQAAELLNSAQEAVIYWCDGVDLAPRN